MSPAPLNRYLVYFYCRKKINGEGKGGGKEINGKKIKIIKNGEKKKSSVGWPCDLKEVIARSLRGHGGLVISQRPLRCIQPMR